MHRTVFKGSFEEFNKALRHEMLNIKWNVLLQNLWLEPEHIRALPSYLEFHRDLLAISTQKMDKAKKY